MRGFQTRHNMATSPKNNQYFRFFCKPIPASSCIDPSKTTDEQNVYSETLKEELAQLNIVGMPIYWDHDSKIRVEEGEDFDKIIYPKNKYVLGYVVHKMISDDGSLLSVVEIPPVDAKLEGTTEGLATLAARKAAITLIENGALNGVSFSHNSHSKYDPSTDLEIVKKYPVEMSITANPLREGSTILSSYFADAPFHSDDSVIKGFDVYKSMSISAIDKAAQERNRKLRNQEEDKNKVIQENNAVKDVNNIDSNTDIIDTNMQANTGNNAAAPPVNGAVNNANPDYNSLLKEVERMRAEIDQYKPAAEQYHKTQQQQREERKQNIINNSKTITENAQNLLDFLLKMDQEKQITLDPTDKLVFTDLASEFPKTKEELPQLMSNILMDDKRMNPQATSSSSTTASSSTAGLPSNMQTGLDRGEMFSAIDQTLATLSKPINSFNAASKYMNQFIENFNKSRSDTQREASKQIATEKVLASTAQTTQVKKQAEPEFVPFEQLRVRAQQRQQQMMADPAEIARIQQLTGSGRDRLY